jgi:hypothetical protein
MKYRLSQCSTPLDERRQSLSPFELLLRKRHLNNLLSERILVRRNPFGLIGRSTPLRVVATLLCVFLCSAYSFSQRTIPLNLERMVQDAGQIFEATVVESRTGSRDPQTNLLVTYITFNISHDFYGTGASQRTIKQYGGEANGVAFYPKDLPRFSPGEKVILFLYGQSALGMQSPVGLSQGKFEIKSDRTGKHRSIASSVPPSQLFNGMSQASGLLKSSRTINNDSLIDYAGFSQMVSDLVKKMKH